MAKHSIAVMVLIATDDPRLDPETIDVSTVRNAASLRQAVIDNLPHLTRVVVVMQEADAQLMCEVHQTWTEWQRSQVRRPPAAYVPPTRD